MGGVPVPEATMAWDKRGTPAARRWCWCCWWFCSLVVVDMDTGAVAITIGAASAAPTVERGRCWAVAAAAAAAGGAMSGARLVALLSHGHGVHGRCEAPTLRRRTSAPPSRRCSNPRCLMRPLLPPPVMRDGTTTVVHCVPLLSHAVLGEFLSGAWFHLTPIVLSKHSLAHKKIFVFKIYIIINVCNLFI